MRDHVDDNTVGVCATPQQLFDSRSPNTQPIKYRLDVISGVQQVNIIATSRNGNAARNSPPHFYRKPRRPRRRPHSATAHRTGRPTQTGRVPAGLSATTGSAGLSWLWGTLTSNVRLSHTNTKIDTFLLDSPAARPKSYPLTLNTPVRRWANLLELRDQKSANLLANDYEARRLSVTFGC